ncbi:nucleolar protein 13 [Podospora conica]|nr:nucleolar protein 13 [Schizothecium conicum]
MATKDLEPEAREHSEEPKSSSSSKKRKSTALKEIEVDVSLPEPPSKKAKRLLKKGKTLPAKPQSSDDEADGDDDKKKAADKKKERSPYGVWVGNLRFNATKTELRKWFVDNSGGAITDELITRVHMPSTKDKAGADKAKAAKADTKKPSENRGFAYVDFATFEANVAAIALSETELAGRKLLIKDSTSFEGRPKKEEAKEGADADEPEVKKNASTKVFVGNLSFQVTEDDLWAHFEKCGKIRWIKVATFEDTGKCKGYGWVNFEEPEAAAWAVKGFVKVKETIDALEDFMDVDEKPAGDADGEDKEGSDDDDAKAKKASKKKKAVPEAEVRIKTRKWWVNQLLGRPLKIELAEDDQTRYNKRFRGEGAKKRMEGAGGAAPSGEKGTGEAKEERKPRVKEPKAIKYANDVNIARLTGAAVASQGKKTTFE